MADRYTEFHVTYDMSDITALKDSTPTTDDNKSFADISKIKSIIETPGQMTLEHNYCVLDGSQEEFDDIPTTLAFFTSQMSDENGEFDDIPTIDVSFTEMHSSAGLTVNFIDDYPLQMRATWYQDNIVIYSDIYDIDANNYIIKKPVLNYNALKFEFLKALPYRYVKINFIRYGILINWTENELKEGNVLFESDLISNMLSNNTLSFQVVDTEDTTNPGNVTGLHNYFQKTQIMYPYEIVNGNRINLGKFFLKDYSYSKNLCKINAVSYMGLFETTQYINGGVYYGTKAGIILDDIFSVLEIEDYTIDDDTYNTLLYGALPPTNCKQALQQILFACNSIIDTTNLLNIRILKGAESIAGTISKNLKFSTKVKKLDYVSGVSIKYKNYALNDTDAKKEVVKDPYNAGTYTVSFSEPHSDYEITNGTIEDSSSFYVTFTVDSDNTEVVIVAYGYDTVDNEETVNRPYIEGGEGENIKSFNTTLCNATTAKNLAKKLLTYYENRLEIEVKHLIHSANMNEKWIIQNSTSNMENYIGLFTRRSINLTGGFIDNAKFVGFFDTIDYNYFMDNELIMDDEVII